MKQKTIRFLPASEQTAAVHQLFQLSASLRRHPEMWTMEPPSAEVRRERERQNEGFSPNTDLSNIMRHDEAGNVIKVDARRQYLAGALNWHMLEELAHLRELDISGHQLTGTFCTTPKFGTLPLVFLDLARLNSSGSPVTGVFNFDHLPTGLQFLDLGNNLFTITNWPSVSKLTDLHTLGLANNNLASVGALFDLALLPPGLIRFSFLDATFAAGGTAADLALLPPSVTQLFIANAANITLYCSDISKFLQLQLTGNTKILLQGVPIVLGCLGDKGALRVTGGKLVQMIT